MKRRFHRDPARLFLFKSPQNPGPTLPEKSARMISLAERMAPARALSDGGEEYRALAGGVR